MKRKSFLFLLSLVICLVVGGCRNTTLKSDGSMNEGDENNRSAQTIQSSDQQQLKDKTDKNDDTENITYKEYQNSRYGFSIDYPSNFVTKLVPANGDGIILISPDGNAELTVSGINNVMSETVNSYYKDFLSEYTDISFKKQQGNWFVASWIEGDKILYTKKVVGTGSINTFLLKYPSEKKEYYDPVVRRLIDSFKTPGISEIHSMVLNDEADEFMDVRNLFISRFCIEGKDKDNILYAVKSSPKEFLYSIYVDRFDKAKNMYEIRLSRYTDTAQNFFYYNADKNKFYFDGAKPEEIKTDDSIYFSSPF